jgi:hypothetical protein
MEKFIFKEEETENFDSLAAMKDSFIDTKKPLGVQPIALSHGQDWSGAPLCVLGVGDYSCITGLSKSKKSFFKSGLIASYIGGNANFYFKHFKSHRKEDKIVIDVDTEQSDYHARRCFKRVDTMVGSRYENYKPFALRKYSPGERLKILETIVEKYKRAIGLICLDGYIDFVDDFNSLTEAGEFLQNLLFWTRDYGCLITGVLHKNPSGTKMIGHIGSLIDRKAGTIISLTSDINDKSISAISHERARDMEFPNLWMKIDKGIPFIVENENSEIEPWDIPEIN